MESLEKRRRPSIERPSTIYDTPAESIVMDNKVLWANPDFPAAPFLFEKGQSTPLGRLLRLKHSEESPVSADDMVLIRTGHGRSAEVPQQYLFRDNAGVLYACIDLKGIGYVNENDAGEPVVSPWQYNAHRKNIKGLEDKKWARIDIKFSELFAQHGMKTSRTLALIDLKQLTVLHDDTEHSVSLAALRSASQRAIGTNPAASKTMHPYIPAEFEPVIQVRAFGIKTRIGDLGEDATRDEQEIAYAQEFVRNESHLHELSRQGYVDQVARSVGRNIGIMHMLGYSHGHVTPHNITIDGRVLDFDSVAPFSLDNSKKSDSSFLRALRDIEDSRWTYGAIPSLLQLKKDCLSGTEDMSDEVVRDIFWEGYKSAFPDDTGTATASAMRRFVEEFTRTVSESKNN